MKKKKRYIAKVDFYIYSTSDKKVIKKAKKISKKLGKYIDRKYGESRLKLICVNSNEFGEFESNRIYGGE